MDVNFLEKYLQDHPDSIMFARLADAYLGMKRVEEAIQLCEEGIKKHPYYATGHFVLAKGYMANSLFEQAEKEFKRVLLFDPKYLGAHKLYGDLMREIGWENTYQMSYKKIMQFDPLEDSVREIVSEGGDKGEEHESTKDLSEFSLASSENIDAPPQKSLDDEEQDWSQDPDWPEQPGWPEEPSAGDKTMSDESSGWPEESDWPAPASPKPEKEKKEPREAEFNSDKDEPAFSSESAFKTDFDPFKEDDEQRDDIRNDIDVDAISPMSVSEEEEDLVFGDDSPSQIEPDETESADATIKPEPESSEKVTEVDEGELDEKEEEQYSYILEDIFKDEVVEEKTGKQTQEQPSREDAKSAFDREADSVMKSYQEPDKDQEDAPEKEDTREPENDDDFPDFSKSTKSEYDFPEQKKPQFTPPPAQSTHQLNKDDDIESEDEPTKNATSASKKKSDKIVTPTLGEIYAAQGQYAKAIDVFEGLLKKHPDNESYNNKIRMLKKKLEEAGNA